MFDFSTFPHISIMCVCVCVCCILLIDPTKNMIKDNERTSINETKRNTLLYKNISLSHFILEKSTQFVVSLRERERERDGETYTQRGDFFLPHIFFLEPGGADTCTPLQAVLSETTQRFWLAMYPSLDSQFWLDWIWLRGSHLMWSPSDYTPAWLAYPDALPSPVY